MSEDYKTYTTKEAAEIVGIKERAIQTRCKRENVRKIDNKYLITDSLISIWRKKKEANASQTQNATQPQLNLEAESLKKTSEEHYKEYLERITQANQSGADLYKLKLELKEFQDKCLASEEKIDVLENNIEELKEELSQYEVGENERIEVFSNEEYQLFEQRLNEWRTLQKDIEHQQELFKIEQKGSEQVIEHYKQQFEYQRQQSTRILEIHEKLVETVNSQNKIALQRNFIEAKDKGFDKK